MSKELPSFNVLMDIFLNTIELSKSLSNSSLEKIKKELEDNSSEIEFDQIIMLKIITSFLRKKQVK
jgi:hypothetical protein